MIIKEMLKFIKATCLTLLFVGFISPVYSANIKWSMPGDSLTLDPHAQNEGPTHMVSRQVYESLVTRGLDMSIEPQLATSWEATDPETWVFTLRDGVVFSDGKALRASDVEFSINRALSGASDMLELIESITSVIPYIDNCSTTLSIIGLLPTERICLGLLLVKGRSLVPKPPTRIMALTA